ncbi:MAG TPA: L-threonylcarbamoyladenylate synthase [Acidimicrobiales bacterium]|nr:L-threonylcarbamoyladenylate synthase [Acidimicrobiales bacterium]
MTARLHVDALEDPDGAADAAVEALLAGEVVLLPTDTVYGLAALPGDERAMDELFAVKGRSTAAPVAVLCTDVRQAASLVAVQDEPALRAVGERWWPGPLTLVLPRREGVELHLGEPAATVGLRVPDHPLVRAIAERVGPVAATSANRHGEPTVVTADEAILALPGVRVIIDEGALEGRASTVIDATTQPWRVLREGPLPADEIVAAGQPRLL